MSVFSRFKPVSIPHSPVSPQCEDAVAEEVSPDSDEFVLELMTECELKLQLLQEELRGKDLAAIMKEMEEEEVRRASQWFRNTGSASGAGLFIFSRGGYCGHTRKRLTRN